MDAHSYVLKSLEASTFLRDILRAGGAVVVVVVVVALFIFALDFISLPPSVVFLSSDDDSIVLEAVATIVRTFSLSVHVDGHLDFTASLISLTTFSNEDLLDLFRGAGPSSPIISTSSCPSSSPSSSSL